MDTTIERAWSVLEAVPDPEIPVVSIRELGILREVRHGADDVLEVVITPTYSGCPAMSQIAEDIAQAIDDAELGAHRIDLPPSVAQSELARIDLRDLFDGGLETVEHGV